MIVKGYNIMHDPIERDDEALCLICPIIIRRGSEGEAHDNLHSECDFQ